jgi:hypothetical protein
LDLNPHPLKAEGAVPKSDSDTKKCEKIGYHAVENFEFSTTNPKVEKSGVRRTLGSFSRVYRIEVATVVSEASR